MRRCHQHERAGILAIVRESGCDYVVKEVACAYLRHISSPLGALLLAKLMEKSNQRARSAVAESVAQPSRNALQTIEPPSNSMVAVNVTHGMVGGVQCEVVDGRELCEKLGVNTRFNDWIPERVKSLNLLKNQEFETFTGKSVKGRPPVEYRLTLEAAKKIAMAEHTVEGNAVRAYFIERERISYEQPQSARALSIGDIASIVKDVVSGLLPTLVEVVTRAIERFLALCERSSDRQAQGDAPGSSRSPLQPGSRLCPRREVRRPRPCIARSREVLMEVYPKLDTPPTVSDFWTPFAKRHVSAAPKAKPANRWFRMMID
jgi:phage anti-repressor protein